MSAGAHRLKTEFHLELPLVGHTGDPLDAERHPEVGAGTGDPHETAEALDDRHFVGGHLVEAGEEEEKEESGDHVVLEAGRRFDAGARARSPHTFSKFGNCFPERIQGILSSIFSHVDSIGTDVLGTTGAGHESGPLRNRSANG